MSTRTAVPRVDTSRLVGGPSGVQQQLTPGTPGKKGTPEPAPLGAVLGEHWRARSVLGTLPDGQKTGLWRTLNQVTCHAHVGVKQRTQRLDIYISHSGRSRGRLKTRSLGFFGQKW